MINQINRSPIMQLERRLSQLSEGKILAFATFCAQAAYGNVDLFLDEVGLGGQLMVSSWIDSWLWGQLEKQENVFPADYDDVETGLVDMVVTLRDHPAVKERTPAPITDMVREAIFTFLSACSFLAKRGKVSQLLTVVDNCVSLKIDAYFGHVLNMDFYTGDVTARQTKLRSFPVYLHAMADLTWVLTLLESESSTWPSSETLRVIRSYAKHCDSMVVREAIYI